MERYEIKALIEGVIYYIRGRAELLAILDAAEENDNEKKSRIRTSR
jgi:hypothetical protein